ncbi:MAG: MarR family transcriptional regulator [Pseudomonadota bacterium]
MFERCLYFNLNAAFRRVNKIWEQAFNDLGLSPAHAYLLRVVLAQPGISQQGIATELKLERSTVTRFIEALESRGFLLRNKSGRERLVYPTQAAREIADGLEQRGNMLYEQMVDSLGEGAVVDLVGKLRSAGSKLS